MMAAQESKVQRLKSINEARCGAFMGYVCILVPVSQVIVGCLVDVTQADQCYHINDLQLAASALWNEICTHRPSNTPVGAVGTMHRRTCNRNPLAEDGNNETQHTLP